MPFHGIEAVLFDLDDTLLDRSSSFANYCEHLIDILFPNGLTVAVRDEVKQVLIKYDENGYNPRNTFYRELIKEWNLPNNAIELEKEWIEKFDKYLIPEGGLIEILEYLSGKYKLGIITNGSSYMQNRKIDGLGIRRFFQSIVVSEDVGIRKPEKEIFLLSCKELGTAAFSTVFVGDSFKIDIMGAVKAGLKAIWINKFLENEEYLSVMSELASIITLL